MRSALLECSRIAGTSSSLMYLISIWASSSTRFEAPPSTSSNFSPAAEKGRGALFFLSTMGHLVYSGIVRHRDYVMVGVDGQLAREVRGGSGQQSAMYPESNPD